MNAMKKNLLLLSAIALIVAGVSTLSCTKLEQEGLTDNPASDDGLTYTISVNRDEGTKALAISGTNLAKTFAPGEKIAVVYIAGGSKRVVVSEALGSDDIKNSGKYASFTVTLEDIPDLNSEVKYIYPSVLATTTGNINYDALAMQDGTLESIASNLDLGLFEGTLSGRAFPKNQTLSNPLTICKFTIKNGGGTDITQNVTRLTIKNGSDIYTIDPTSSKNVFWVAIKPVATGDITVYAACGKDLYKKTVSDVTLASSNLYPINVTAPKVDGAISGLFRIGDNLIYFSKGNLCAIDPFSATYWERLDDTTPFAKNQYDYVGNNYANISILSDGYINPSGYVDLFGWSTAATTYGINPSGADATYSGTFRDWGGKVKGSWHTPSRNEWTTIINNYTHGHATVNGVHGVVFIPYRTTITGFNTSNDSWGNNTYDASQWADMEAVGAVFLPAAGYRGGTSIYKVNDKGSYWSSDAYGSSQAYYMSFISGSGPTVGVATLGDNLDDGDRGWGHSVRLIGE